MSSLYIKTSSKLLYASGDFSQLGIETILRLFLLFYLVNFVGFGPAVGSVIIIGGIIWDAVSDPLMGWISDKYYLRLKGRHQFVYFGAVLTGVLIGFMFTSHLWLPKNWLLFTLLYVLMNTAITVFSVPHTSVPGDFAFSASQRTNLFAWRFGFGNLGALLASVVVAVLQGSESDDVFYFTVLGFSGINLIIGYISGYGTKKIESAQKLKAQEEAPGLSGFLNTLKNKSFLPLLLGYLLANIGVGINSAAALFYYKDYLKITEKETGLMLVAFFLVIGFSLAGWVKISEKYGKLKPLQFGSFLLGAGTCVAYPLFPIGNFVYPLVIGGIVLGSLVGCVILLDSLLTDVADLGELKSGVATTAIYFGIWKFTMKLARAIALGITGLVIDGSVGAGATGEIATERLPWLFGPGVGVFLLIAAGLMSLYQFTDEKQMRVSRLLARKRQRKQMR